MKRVVGCLVVVALLAGFVPPKVEAMGKGKLALIAGATTAIGIAAIVMPITGSGGKPLFKPREVVGLSLGCGVLMGGAIYVGMAATEQDFRRYGQLRNTHSFRAKAPHFRIGVKF